MAIIERVDNDLAEIAISDRFVFNDSSEFRKRLFSIFDRKVRSLSIDIGDLHFMDSSGLGMLMVALSECNSRNIAMSVRRPQGEVKALLQMTKSYERFKIIE